MELYVVFELPADILCAVFGVLSLRQKLTCEFVCKTWQQLLRGQHASCTQQLSTIIWGLRLRLRLYMPQPTFPVDKIAICEEATNHDELPQIVLTDKTSNSLKRRGFLHWFERLILAVSTIEISLVDSDPTNHDLEVSSLKGGRIFPHLLVAIHLSRQDIPISRELHLSTGTHVVLSM